MICKNFSSDFLIETCGLPGQRAEYAKELLLNHHRKFVQNSRSLEDIWVELKL